MSSRLLKFSSFDPFLNIAIEHALLYYAPNLEYPMTVRIWNNNPSVVVGRIQDVESEVNVPYCRRLKIPIIRRISGGGTVYHDRGNLNVSFILKRTMLGQNIDIITCTEIFTDLLIKSLENIGYSNLEREGHSNILYNNKKISGSAGYFRKGWFLHHATLLFGININKLNQTLLARDKNPKDTSKSRYFETTNLPNFDQTVWEGELLKQLNISYNLEFNETNISSQEMEYSRKLHTKLYIKDEWNYNGKRKVVSPDLN